MAYPKTKVDAEAYSKSTGVDAEANPETVAEENPGPGAKADPRPDAEEEPRLCDAANPTSDTTPQPHEADGDPNISSDGNAVSWQSQGSLKAAGADHHASAVTVRKASNAAKAMKRELEQQAVPAAKRPKAVSKESLAAMAAIAATAQLPTQVITVTPLTLERFMLRLRCHSISCFRNVPHVTECGGIIQATETQMSITFAHRNVPW